MKNFILATFLLIFLAAPAFAGKYASELLTAVGGQTAIGNSTNVATTGLNVPIACKVTITGTSATLHLECQNGIQGWEDVSSSETSESKQWTIWNACFNMRSEVTECTACNVVVFCEWNQN